MNEIQDSFGMQSHWENVYTHKAENEVSWFQEYATTSMRLIQNLKLSQKAQIIDIGGGASVLVDDLLKEKFENITVLDLSQTALNISKQRLGESANNVEWIAANVMSTQFSHQYDLWHDRAVFHFLTHADERERYLKQVAQSVKQHGYVIMATFAEDGPMKCSGLEIQRYSVDMLKQLFEAYQFELIYSEKNKHITPAGNEQKFNYWVFKKLVE